MTDIFSQNKRSKIMAAVKSKDSAIERSFLNYLKSNGVKMSSHSKSLPGNPDFYSRRKKIVVFIDSCFWHGCRYHGSRPKTNRAFWNRKLSRNRERDREINLQYRKTGWNIFRIWEHTIKSGFRGGRISKLLSLARK